MSKHNRCIRCVTDDDLAAASLFILENKHDLHPSMMTVDTLSLIYHYLTRGHLMKVVDANNRTIGTLAYFHGTPEEEFADKNIAFVDLAITDRTYRGSRLFVNGLRSMAEQIAEAHPEVEELRFAAMAENDYLCRLYAKFAEIGYSRDGQIGKEFVFCVKLHRLRTILSRFDRV